MFNSFSTKQKDYVNIATDSIQKLASHKLQVDGSPFTSSLCVRTSRYLNQTFQLNACTSLSYLLKEASNECVEVPEGGGSMFVQDRRVHAWIIVVHIAMYSGVDDFIFYHVFGS